jgi:nitroimidazol reductase NimA-like FMN-containing flavoprotein (pyridoxamine 5'-phosphate oxidase superfamily)
MTRFETSAELGYDAQGLLRLNDEECWRFLGKHFLGRVAVIDFGMPMVFPVNYAVDGRSIVFRTAPGTKLTMAALGRDAAFEVDEVFGLFETGTSVMVHGTIHEVTDHDEKARLMALPLRPWAPGRRDHVVRVHPSWVSGRRIPVHALDDGLNADAG